MFNCSFEHYFHLLFTAVIRLVQDLIFKCYSKLFSLLDTKSFNARKETGAEERNIMTGEKDNQREKTLERTSQCLLFFVSIVQCMASTVNRVKSTLLHIYTHFSLTFFSLSLSHTHSITSTCNQPQFSGAIGVSGFWCLLNFFDCQLLPRMMYVADQETLLPVARHQKQFTFLS